jgi:putative flavoprotein involved in K+ transport
MSAPVLDVVVVGAGQAGLAISQCLKRDGLRHIVLERGRIGKSWRTRRWDSFALNSPNKFNTLPGDTYEGTDPDGFDSAKGFVSYLEDYADRHQFSGLDGVPRGQAIEVYSRCQSPGVEGDFMCARSLQVIHP